ncbi:MAG: DUF1566 domain-containing protein [Bacteroidales bacterium]|nr:DUF1566 domain-containing protein [Bacteroidales bacterium]
MKKRLILFLAITVNLMIITSSCSKDDYESLPTFTYNGSTYRVAPSTDNLLAFGEAYSYCSNYSIGGVGEWRMPTRDEMVQMYNSRKKIKGFKKGGEYWCDAGLGIYSDYYFYVSFARGGEVDDSWYYHSDKCYVRPIHLEVQYQYDPIEVDD